MKRTPTKNNAPADSQSAEAHNAAPTTKAGAAPMERSTMTQPDATPSYRERMIPFIPTLVPSLLSGAKWQTRRPIAAEGIEAAVSGHYYPSIRFAQFRRADGRDSLPVLCPLGAPGDVILVRERARLIEVEEGLPFVAGVVPRKVRLRYEADGAESGWVDYPPRLGGLDVGKCIPNGVYREGARIRLGVTEVRVQRVQDISEEDAIAEGIARNPVQPGTWVDYPEGSSAAGWKDPRQSFRSLWVAIYGAASWDRNDWVWAVSFRLLKGGA